MTALSQRSGVTQLEFHQAMNDFKTMFPEMDEDVIEAVLRANNGAVDATIDQLLAMNLDSENERLRAELDATDNEVPPRYSPATPPPSYHSLQPQTIAANASPNRRSQSKVCESNQRTNNALMTTTATVNANSSNSNPSKDSMRFKRKWNPPILGQLPNSFLRIEPDENQRKLASTLVRPKREVTVINSAMLQQRMEENQRQRQLSSADDPELAQFLEDERVAIFLQNEEFVRELRRNKDFMSTLELDTSGDMSNSNSIPSGPSVATSHSDSDAAFKETLKHMGKVSRRKFAQLARLFWGRRRRSFQHLLSSNESNNPSRDNLLIREDEYTQLQNEGSDNEDIRENQLDFRMSQTDQQLNPNITNNSNSPINSTHRVMHRN